MVRRAELPHTLRHAPFTASEAAEAGVSRSRLLAKDLHHPHHGAYDARAGDDLVSRCERLSPLLGPSSWFGGLTAARLLEAPLPVRYDPCEPLHVLTLAGAQPLRRPGVVGWETDRSDIERALWNGLPVVAAAEVWCQLAVPGAIGVDPETGYRRRLDEHWLVAVGDFFVSGLRVRSQRTSLCTPAELEAARRRHGRRRGATALGQALPRVRSGVDSPWETFTRLGLVDHGLPEPDTQTAVPTRQGVLHADLGYPQARLALEFQGDEHRSNRRRWLSDLTRVQLMEDAGWKVILVGADDVRPDCGPLAARVRRALTRLT